MPQRAPAPGSGQEDGEEPPRGTAPSRPAQERSSQGDCERSTLGFQRKLRHSRRVDMSSNKSSIDYKLSQRYVPPTGSQYRSDQIGPDLTPLYTSNKNLQDGHILGRGRLFCVQKNVHIRINVSLRQCKCVPPS